MEERALVVDDSAVNRAVLTALMRRAGVGAVDHSCDGAEALAALDALIAFLESEREKFVADKTDKQAWHNMIQLLPSSYNQMRTVTLNYEVLSNMYYARRTHKLAEWHTLCEWIESLPYASQLILNRE